jgi:hypothetical protein
MLELPVDHRLLSRRATQMKDPKATNSPLLGYNTNVRHGGHLFHIQTEDSGRDHPHVITHLFTSGTILATKKTAYGHVLDDADWENRVRQMMKDQHKSMFVELRDGTHDTIASQILGAPIGADELPAIEDEQPAAEAPRPGPSEVRVIQPAQRAAAKPQAPKGRSIFEAPETAGQFGESLISDKSLDEVILDYLKDELD